MPTRPTRYNFTGLTEYLKGSIYDFGTISQSNRFITTTKSIARYVGRTCIYPKHIRISIKNLEYATISIPAKQEDIDEDIDKILLGKELDVYVKRRQIYCQNKVTLYSVML